MTILKSAVLAAALFKKFPLSDNEKLADILHGMYLCRVFTKQLEELELRFVPGGYIAGGLDKYINEISTLEHGAETRSGRYLLNFRGLEVVESDLKEGYLKYPKDVTFLLDILGVKYSITNNCLKFE